MRVVQINAVYEYGSTGRSTMEIHQTLIKMGEESCVFCTNFCDERQNVFMIGNKIDHKIHAFMSRLTGLQAYFSKVATKRLIEKLEKFKPEIIHLQNLHANYINLSLLLRYLAKKDIATVVTLHDCWFFTGHCCHYTEDKCDKWLTGCGNCPALRKYNISWFFDRSKKIYKDKKQLFEAIPKLAVVGNSEWTTTQARKSLLKKAQIIEKIYNWINLDEFYPHIKGTNVKFTILGVAQSWTEKKGLSVFVRIAEHYSDCRVVIIGKIEHDVKLPDNVLIVGITNSIKELAKYYSIADVFVNTSIQETFGNVSAEALACGTPIVVNNATANPELVEEGCGYVADNNNIDSYFAAIDQVRYLGKANYSEKCVQFARNNFDMKNNINKYIMLYNRLLW